MGASMSVERYTVKVMPKTIWLNLADDDSETEYRLASDYDALEAERDAIRSDFDALGAHYREALAERDKLQVQVNEFKGGACPLSFLEQTQYDRDQWKARAEAAEKLAIGSIRFMEDDFPEAPEEIDDACVSSAYLNHYKALLALREAKKEGK